MVNLIMVTIVLGIAYWRIRNLYYNKIELEYRHNLYALRDKLRRYAIESKIDSKEWVFDYMDSTFCKSIKSVTSLNIFIVALIAIRHRNDKAFNSFSTKCTLAINKNKYCKELFDEFGIYLFEYFSKKHYILMIFFKILSELIKSISYCNDKINRTSEMVKNLRIYPETSTGNNFYKFS